MPPPPRPPRVLVTGANGFIGSRVASLLLRRGWDVRTLTRGGWHGDPQVPAASRFLGTLPHDVPAACVEGVDTIIHCAGLTGAGSEALARAVNVDGTLALARLLAGAGGKRFVYLSSQSARADAPAAYGRTRHEAEAALLAMPGLEAVVVRPGLVLGSGAAGLFGRMREMVRMLPFLPLPGGGRAVVQPIHVDDLAEGLARCAEGAVPGGSILRLGDPAGLPLKELLQRLAIATTGASKPALPIPVAPLVPVARAAEALGVPLPVTTASLRALGAVERMDTAPDLARLGLTLRPLDEALKDVPGAARAGFVRRLLQEPRARGLDVDGVDLTLAHREILRTKPQTRSLFARFYDECVAKDALYFGDARGARWELGSGAGFMGELHPDVVTSDVKPLPFTKATCTAEAIPVADGSLRAVYMVNVFHHLPDPRAFFREMQRALAPGGGVVMIEPWHGPVAAFLFKRLHASEGFEPYQPAWEAPADAGPMSKANQALSYVVFRRDRATFEREFPDLEIVLERPHTHLSYLLSGGVNFRSLAPAWASGAIEAVERMLSPVAPVIALQQTIVLRKRRAPAGRA